MSDYSEGNEHLTPPKCTTVRAQANGFSKAGDRRDFKRYLRRTYGVTLSGQDTQRELLVLLDKALHAAGGRDILRIELDVMKQVVELYRLRLRMLAMAAPEQYREVQKLIDNMLATVTDADEALAASTHKQQREYLINQLAQARGLSWDWSRPAWRDDKQGLR